jgi:hypothetical protein
LQINNYSLIKSGLNIPGEDDSWDFGTGAGFYVVFNTIVRFNHLGCNCRKMEELSNVFIYHKGTAFNYECESAD